ncbi:two-component regulator propeller domain-containing protein [Dyadobacter arcticus]|uniref:histidine kinase n=1 Tax=Dyadobacter arcticus TaxID=1078754 RepID=A0ABX0UMH5_9BACT|nr:two-component regulator propeller domain-containing protein [Dyadobacter arcticus]NIJ54213.1 signal transduction histidine kinase/ligand-binding sensor domain-containing protein [Dyadobacter arcticus]
MKKVKKVTLKHLLPCLLLLVASGMNVSAQITIDPEYLSVANGIASPTVNDILQDHYGLLWLATGNGLQKYDGYRFETFKNVRGKSNSLQNNNCWDLMEDPDHNIWVSNEQGVSYYDRKKKEFVNYNIGTIFRNITGSGAGRSFRMITDKKGQVWVTTGLLELLKLDRASQKWEYAKYEGDSINQQSHQGILLAITQDAKGGIWIGSAVYGLMHLAPGDDTFRFVQPHLFGHLKTDFNQISALYFDVNNILWITASDGVYKYDPALGTLKTIKIYTEGIQGGWASWNRIGADPSGNIWVANNFHGILKFKGTSDQFEEVTLAGKVKVPKHGWNITLTNFMVDRGGVFWFGSLEFGLLKYNPVSKPFSVIARKDGDPTGISGIPYSLLASKAKPGTLYVGTKGYGLSVFDTKTQKAQKVTFDVVNDMYGGSVRSIAENDDGTLWVGTWGDGLLRLDKNYKEVERYSYQYKSREGIASGKVRVIKPDQNGRLWLGTADGLDIFDPKTEQFQNVVSTDHLSYPQELVDEMEKLSETGQKVAGIEGVTEMQNKSRKVEIKSAGKYAVMAVGEGDPAGPADYGWIEGAPKDTIWKMASFAQSMHAGGAAKNRIDIKILDLRPGSYTLRYTTDDSHSYGNYNEPGPDVSSVYGMRLVKLTDTDEAFLEKRLHPEQLREKSITGSDIIDIEIGKKYVWVGALEKGFNRIDPISGEVKHFMHDLKNENSLADNAIADIFEDEEGIVWITNRAGLNKFDPRTEKFTLYSEADGLPTDNTVSLLPGQKGEIWISTQNGLSQMITNKALGKVMFINYNSADGLGSDGFGTYLVAAKTADGQFYFGADHGLTSFKSFKGNDTPPPIIISNLLISNKSVLDMKEDSPVKGDLLNTESVIFAHDQNNIGFEFAALHYANPLKNQYAHMLKGYDKDWIYDNRNFASYTNLEPGDYEFMVRASNAYGVWNEKGKILKVTILPPWWRTWWAYAAYVIVLALLIFSVNRYMRERIKTKEREKSRERELQQAREIEKAYTELKATQNQLIQSEKMASLGELAAGIAHEIQNPLNFINNFSELNQELLDEMKTELASGNVKEATGLANDVIQNLEKINNHGKRADSIVKGMLQHSRSSSGIKEPTDINALTDEYIRLGYHGLRAKDQTFNAAIKTDFDPSLEKVGMIPQDIGRVVLNLLNNAFYAVQQKQKELPESDYEPTVTVSTKKTANNVLLHVRDNGNGIPQRVVDKIFQPFFTTKPTGQGTGLGLSLSYDIVTKGHGGELKVETSEGKGSVFMIILPI